MGIWRLGYLADIGNFAPAETANAMFAGEAFFFRRILATPFLMMVATVLEATSRRQIRQPRHHPLDDRQRGFGSVASVGIDASRPRV